ncbi:MAG: bifunctional pyr operon transcriptional regulator/uracil phosphoribosyltransferase PyrR [Actinomycetota bacterium]
MQSRTVLTSSDIDRAVTRISHEILESNQGSQNLVILGIPTRGAVLAKRIVESIAKFESIDSQAVLGTLDITMHRDDLDSKPTRNPAKTVIPAGGLDGKVVVLVDDVLFSGRTIRAALDALGDYGRPSAVRLAVLITRESEFF